jgi:hypothetical protein
MANDFEAHYALEAERILGAEVVDSFPVHLRGLSFMPRMVVKQSLSEIHAREAAATLP